MYVRCTIKNGKLHGIVQMFGIFPMDLNGRCPELLSHGLSFIGLYENGQPSGPCWRQRIGNVLKKPLKTVKKPLKTVKKH